MRVQRLHNDQINTDRWDHLAMQSPHGRLEHLSWYLDTIAPDWEGVVLDDYRAVLPIFPRRKWGIGYHFRPFWGQQFGVISNEILQDAEYEAIYQVASRDALYFEWVGHFGMGDVKWPGVRTDHANYVLHLAPSYQQIYEGYAKNTHRNLRKAENWKMAVSSDVSPEALISQFRANRGKDLSHLSEDDYARLKHLLYVIIHRGRGQSRAIYDETNTLIAGAFFAFHHNRIVFLFSSNTEIGKERRAMFKILDELIIEYSGRDVLLDFEGSMDADVARFYEGFGATNEPYPLWVDNRLPALLRWIK